MDGREVPERDFTHDIPLQFFWVCVIMIGNRNSCVSVDCGWAEVQGASDKNA